MTVRYVREYFRPRVECRDVCTCERPMCRCGYLVLDNGRCMTCYRSPAQLRGEEPSGVLSADRPAVAVVGVVLS